MQALTEDDRIKLGEQASMLATLSVILCFMASCGGCITVFVAVPLSMWGLSLARTALDTPQPTAVVDAWARPARTMNLVALIYSGLLSLFIVTYIGLYGVAIVGVVVAAALGL